MIENGWNLMCNFLNIRIALQCIRKMSVLYEWIVNMQLTCIYTHIYTSISLISIEELDALVAFVGMYERHHHR